MQGEFLGVDKRLRRIFGCFLWVFIADLKKGSTFASAFGNDRWLFRRRGRYLKCCIEGWFKLKF